MYKVETIGDAYMVVGGVPTLCDNHAERVLNVSIGMLMESKLVMSPITHRPIRMRIGVHSGAVVAGVVGMKMPRFCNFLEEFLRYCLFGDTVNVANKMEACGVPCKIHVSEPAKKFGVQTNPSFVFADRGNTEIKTKGIMYTYFLERNDRRSVWELCSRPRSLFLVIRQSSSASEQTIDGYMELHDMSVYGGGTPSPPRSPKKNSLKKNGRKVRWGFITVGDLPNNNSGYLETAVFAGERHGSEQRHRQDTSRSVADLQHPLRNPLPILPSNPHPTLYTPSTHVKAISKKSYFCRIHQ